MELKPITVLVTGCGGMYSDCLIKSLRAVKERSIRLIGTDIDENCFSKNKLDAFYKVSAFDDVKYVDELLDICASEKVDVVIPTASAELLKLSDREESFGIYGTKLSISNYGSLFILTNKLYSYEFFKNIGVMWRKFKTISTHVELNDVFSDYKCKFVVKGARGSGSKGVRIVNKEFNAQKDFFEKKPGLHITPRMLECILGPKFPDVLIDEYVEGTEYSVDLVASNGKIVAMCGRLNPVINNSIPMYSKVCENDRAFAICNMIVSQLGLEGNIDVDFIIREDGGVELLEVNPRIGATAGMFTEAGVNLPYISVKVALGEDLSGVNVKASEISMKRAYCEHYFTEG